MAEGDLGAPLLADDLRARIRQNGPMRFVDWMESCLYGEQGYYMGSHKKTGAGADADFATSPTLHPFMAHAVAAEIDDAWKMAGRPDRFDVYEFGGGEGDLARDAAAAAEAPITWHHVERSPHHQELQAGSQVKSVKPGPAFVIAHEFVDALAFHWLERTEDGWSEVAVDVDGERFLERLVPASVQALDAAPEGEFRVGQRVVAMAQAKSWLMDLPHTGRTLIVDYGAHGMRLWGRDPKHGTVRTFRQHQDGGSPLDGPGTKDITASVDFALLQDWAHEAGHQVVSDESQEAFLLRHGALEALNAIDRDSLEGASQYLRLRQMLIPHAGGMGHAFRALVFERGA